MAFGQIPFGQIPFDQPHVPAGFRAGQRAVDWRQARPDRIDIDA
jgi:hypothetical protein